MIGQRDVPSSARGSLDRRPDLRRKGWSHVARMPRRILALDESGEVPVRKASGRVALDLVLESGVPIPDTDILLGVDGDGGDSGVDGVGGVEGVEGVEGVDGVNGDHGDHGVGRVGVAICLRLVTDRTQVQAAHWSGLRRVVGQLSAWERELVFVSIALGNWHRTHTHCPRCGSPTEVAGLGWWRVCPSDGSEHYPRTDPAIITAVLDEADNVLLARQARWPRGAFSTLAGFVEAGESAEAALAREVREEVGLDVVSTTFHGSQPWPFPGSLMLGFTCRVPGVRPQTHPDGEEIIEAAWYSAADLVAAGEAGEVRLPGRVSIANALLRSWYGADIPEEWCRW